MEQSFATYLVTRYGALKNEHPQDGRRRHKLKAAQEFWQLPLDAKQRLASAAPLADVTVPVEAIDEDDDDYDTETGIGVVIRTDYTNEDAWQAFCTALRETEKDFATDESTGEGGKAATADEDSTVQAQGSADPTDEDEETDEEDVASTAIFCIVDAPPDTRHNLTNISNLTALRLFNDVDITRAPSPPEGTKRIKPPNRLIDYDGFQEIYTGKLLWIYDAQSNVDQSVRSINQRSDVYGTATGDSWRPRVSFLAELQINLYSGAMKIDFGGLDRWDYNERQRNLAEASLVSNV